MWWILQITGSIGVIVAQVFNRQLGVGLSSWLIYVCLASTVTYWSFAKSYSMVPTFAQGWFVGQTALNCVGILAMFFVFKDSISSTQWVGIAMSIIGGYLLLIK